MCKSVPLARPPFQNRGRPHVVASAPLNRIETGDDMKVSILLAVMTTLALAEAPASPQTAGNLTGLVTDANTGNPISSAQVSVDGTGLRTLTAADGRYSLSVAIPESSTREVIVRVVMIGYTQAATTVRVGVGVEAVEVDFALQPSGIELRDLRAGPIFHVDAEGRLKRTDELRGMVGAPMDAVAPPAGATRLRSFASMEGFNRHVDVRHGRYDPDFQREGYDRIYENPFLATGANPLSTFSIDVDRASYSNVRRFIRSGRLPPADAVRIEELINYFTYDYAEPEGPHPFSVTTEVAPAPWNPLHRLVRISLQGRTIDTENLPASNLVFLIDVSGSMNAPDKLPLLKSALQMLVQELRPQDRVAIVVYAGAAGLVLDSTPGDEKHTIMAALDDLRAGGSTAGGAGIELAYRVARRNHIRGGNNRVILATDGDFNVGASSDGEMVRLIEEKRERGSFLTVLGFGTGNLQDAKMEKLADHGNGNFAYIDDLMEAKKVLVTELGGTLHTIAKDVKLQVEFNPARVRGYRLIGYENRIMAAEDFDDDTKDAGDLGSGHSVTALYEIIPQGVESGVEIRGRGPLRYRSTSVRPAAEADSELLFVKVRYKQAAGAKSVELTHTVYDQTSRASDDLRFAASVAAFGMVLRGSKHCGATTLADVVGWARASVGADLEGYRAEFVRMVRAAQRLQPDPVPAL